MSQDLADVEELRELSRATERARQKMNSLAAARQDRMLALSVEHRLTQRQLADLLDVSQTVVQHAIEAARRRPLPALSLTTPEQMGGWVREARRRKKWTVDEVARRADVAPDWLRDVEAGHRVRKVGALPRVFDVLEMDVRKFPVTA